MPENSAVSGSWTITRPPLRLIARTPSEPSLPVPLSTTPIACTPYAAATDSKRRSPEGRRKWTNFDRVSDKVPSSLTSR
jgi:hypothetical protein